MGLSSASWSAGILPSGMAMSLLRIARASDVGYLRDALPSCVRLGLVGLASEAVTRCSLLAICRKTATMRST